MDDLTRQSDAIKALEKRIVEDTIVYQKKIPNPEEVSLLASEIFTDIPAVEPCKDAVSREWLLTELEEMNVANFYEANFHSNEMYGQMKRMLKAAPSVTVEPKQGEWEIIKIEPYNFKFRCKECGWYEHHAYENVKPYNYCPQCGAKMKGADDE